MVNGEVQLTIRNKGCSVTSRFSDEVVLVMVESGANSKNEQSVTNSWSRCDIDTCGFSLRLITYSRTAPCKCRYSSFNEVLFDGCCEKFDMYPCEHHNMSVQDEMIWDPLGSHDQGNQSRNGFVHQTVVLVKKAVLAEKSAR